MSEGYDVEARMAQIIGEPERIPPLEMADMSPEALQLVENLRSAFGISPDGIVPPVLRTMLQHPGLFSRQVDMGIELVGRGTIPPREREIAVLRNAWLIGAPYEWGEHVDIGKKCGLTAEEVERTTVGSSAPGWSDHDAAICRGVEELQADTMISDQTWATLGRTWSKEQLIEFPILVGQYTSTAFFQNTLRVRLADDNPGLSYR